MLALPVVLPRLDLATLDAVPQGVTRQNQAVFFPEVVPGAVSRQVVLSHKSAGQSSSLFKENLLPHPTFLQGTRPAQVD